MNKSIGWVTLVLMLGAACATRVNIAPTHRDDIAAPAGILAMAAANLETAVRGRTGVLSEETAVDAIIKFHTRAEEFAQQAGHNDLDLVNTRYEKMIDAWVHVKRTFPDLHPDALMTDSYTHVQEAWEKMARVSGYAGKKYQEKIERQ